MREDEDSPGREQPALDDLSEDLASADDAEQQSAHAPRPSLSDDVKALVEDGKTYAEAEIAFQKSRAAFTSDRAKSIAIYGVFAFGFLHLALVVLVVGSVFALGQVINPWLATGIVFFVLLLAIAALALVIRKKAKDIIWAFGKNSDE